MSNGKIWLTRRAKIREWIRGMWRLRRFKDEIDSHELVLPLVVTSFVTGALDATCYADLATFAANQTGNVIIITVGVAHIAPPGHETRLNAYSLAGYVVSALIAGRLGEVVGPRRRFWIMLSHVTQVAFLVVGLALLYTEIIAAQSIVMLLIFAATSGVQVSQARTSSVPEIPTAMLSTPLMDLIVDPNLFKLSITDPSVRGRNRRVAHITAMAGGGFAGAFMRKKGSSSAVLLFSVIIKSLLTAGFWLVPTAAERQAWRESKVSKAAMSSDSEHVTSQTVER